MYVSLVYEQPLARCKTLEKAGLRYFFAFSEVFSDFHPQRLINIFSERTQRKLRKLRPEKMFYQNCF